MELNFKQYFCEHNDDWTIAAKYLHEPDVKVHQIAPSAKVYRIIKKLNINPNRKITNHRNVKALANTGLSHEQIGQLTGYTARHVKRIIGDNNGD